MYAVIIWYKSTLVGWTDIGRKIQCLSNPCPSPVQGLSKKRSCRGSVKSPSKYSPSSVKPLSSSETLGQRLDRQIQRLSRACPLNLKIVSFFPLDKLSTDIGLGKKYSGFTFWVFEKSNGVDKYWTNIGRGQTLDKVWIHATDRPWPTARCPPICLYWTNIGQTLDLDRLWTKSGILPPIAARPPLAHHPPICINWTNIGHGQILDKVCIYAAHCPLPIAQRPPIAHPSPNTP